MRALLPLRAHRSRIGHNIRMSTLNDESELLACFRELDRGDVELAPELSFPLSVADALAWAVGPRAFVLLRPRPNAKPFGIVFHRNSGGLPDVAAMCEWCHAVRRHGGVKLMSVRADDRRRV